MDQDYTQAKPRSGYRSPYKKAPQPPPGGALPEPIVRGVPRGAALWLMSQAALVRYNIPRARWALLAEELGRQAEHNFNLGPGHAPARRLARSLLQADLRTPQQADSLTEQLRNLSGQLSSDLGMYYIAQQTDPSLVEAARLSVLAVTDRIEDLLERVESLVG